MEMERQDQESIYFKKYRKVVVAKLAYSLASCVGLNLLLSALLEIVYFNWVFGIVYNSILGGILGMTIVLSVVSGIKHFEKYKELMAKGKVKQYQSPIEKKVAINVMIEGMVILALSRFGGRGGRGRVRGGGGSGYGEFWMFPEGARGYPQVNPSMVMGMVMAVYYGIVYSGIKEMICREQSKSKNKNKSKNGKEKVLELRLTRAIVNKRVIKASLSYGVRIWIGFVGVYAVMGDKMYQVISRIVSMAYETVEYSVGNPIMYIGDSIFVLVCICIGSLITEIAENQMEKMIEHKMTLMEGTAVMVQIVNDIKEQEQEQKQKQDQQKNSRYNDYNGEKKDKKRGGRTALLGSLMEESMRLPMASEQLLRICMSEPLVREMIYLEMGDGELEKYINGVIEMINRETKKIENRELKVDKKECVERIDVGVGVGVDIQIQINTIRTVFGLIVWSKTQDKYGRVQRHVAKMISASSKYYEVLGLSLIEKNRKQEEVKVEREDGKVKEEVEVEEEEEEEALRRVIAQGIYAVKIEFYQYMDELMNC